jgi:diguanylate cyclase (GGDEF)-like protein/putative nucleotidyltransferase with HDIG domain
MNSHALVPLLVSIVDIILLVVLLLSRPWQRQQRLFFWFLIVAILWSLVDITIRGDFFIQSKLLLVKIGICLCVWTLLQLHFFLFSFTKAGGSGYPYLYIFIVATILLAALGYAPRDIDITEPGVHVYYGIWYLGVILLLVIVGGRDVYLLAKRLRPTTNVIAKNQVVYLLVGIGIFIPVALFSFLPGGGGYPWAHLGNLCIAGIFLYTVVVHRLLDIGVVFRRALVWLILSSIAIGVTTLVFFLAHLVLGFDVRPAVLACGIASGALAFVLVYRLADPFWRGMERAFLGERHGYREQLHQFISGIGAEPDLGEAGCKLVTLVSQAVDSLGASLLLPRNGNGKGDFVIFASYPLGEDNPIAKLRLRQDNPIVIWLRQKNEALSGEQLSILPEFQALWSEEKAEIESAQIGVLVPLMNKGKLVAIMSVMPKRNGKLYSLEDINIIESTTDDVASTLEKDYLAMRMQERETELAFINRLAVIATTSIDIAVMFNSFTEELREFVSIDWATIALVEDKQLRFMALSETIGSPWAPGEAIRLGGTGTAYVITTKEPLIEADLTQQRSFWTGEYHLNQGIRSIIYLPLITKGEAFGAMIIGSRSANSYGDREIRLLGQAARQVSGAIVLFKLYEQSEKRARVDELTGLFNRRHFDESLRREIAIQSRGGGVLSLIFLDLDLFKGYNDRFGHPEGDKILARVAFLIEGSIRSVDLAFRHGGDEFAVILPGAVGRDAFEVAERVRNKISGAMKAVQTGITASLGLASWPSDAVTPDDVVTAADRALYYAKRTGGDRICTVSEMVPQQGGQGVQGTNSDKEALSVIYALASTIEARDQYTYGHSRNVSRYAVALAEALGLPSEKVAIVGTAALLHDIGKIGVPDEVLNKPDKLTTEEWDLIRSHPRLSAVIVGHVLSLTPCLPAILHHQEKWNGTGYPSGLKGKSIPLEARILAIADAFEAMTSSRPYRGALSCKVAVQELKRNAGKQFDPKIVDAFLPVALSLVPSGAEIGKI